MVEKKEVKVEKKVSSAKEKYAQLIAAYKIQNPVKYEWKRSAFEKKLASL